MLVPRYPRPLTKAHVGAIHYFFAAIFLFLFARVFLSDLYLSQGFFRASERESHCDLRSPVVLLSLSVDAARQAVSAKQHRSLGWQEHPAVT